MPHFHKFLSGFFEFLVLNLDLARDVGNFTLWQDFLAEEGKQN